MLGWRLNLAQQAGVPLNVQHGPCGVHLHDRTMWWGRMPRRLPNCRRRTRPTRSITGRDCGRGSAVEPGGGYWIMGVVGNTRARLWAACSEAYKLTKVNKNETVTPELNVAPNKQCETWRSKSSNCYSYVCSLAFTSSLLEVKLMLNLSVSVELRSACSTVHCKT